MNIKIMKFIYSAIAAVLLYSLGVFQANSQDIIEDKVYFTLDEMPEFPGGEDALRNYIMNDVKYPEIAKENGIQGKVFISFVVSKNGSVKDVKVARAVDTLLDKEALRVIKSLPGFKPGKQRGQTVNVNYIIPVNFVLDKSNQKKKELKQ